MTSTIADMRKRRSVIVDGGAKACINCRWFDQYYRRCGGKRLTGVDAGMCMKHQGQRGALQPPCGDFENEKDPA